MLTAETCLQRAAEAERLAALVSYERDRVRLTRQAAEWRDKAAELAAAPAAPTDEEAPRSWLRRLFAGRGRRAG